MSVFCVDWRLEFYRKTIAALSAAASKQWDTRPPELSFNLTKVLRGLEQSGFGDFNQSVTGD